MLSGVLESDCGICMMRFNTSEVQAISVVLDPSKDWQRAIEKMPELAKATTLFDVEAVGKLGLLTLPSSMHRVRCPDIRTS